MSKDTSGPAFPAEVELKNPGAGPKTYLETGMTLRDYFAAKAMQPMLTDPKSKGLFYFVASEAYEMADAMLQAREAA